MIIIFTGWVAWSAGGKAECCEGKIFVLYVSSKNKNGAKTFKAMQVPGADVN